MNLSTQEAQALDRFAGIALSQFLIHFAKEGVRDSSAKETAELMCRASYDIARGMLDARRKVLG